MLKTNIESILIQNDYPNHIITVLGNNKYNIRIIGEVHVQQIKELFSVIKWSYEKGNAEFYINGII